MKMLEYFLVNEVYKMNILRKGYVEGEGKLFTIIVKRIREKRC